MKLLWLDIANLVSLVAINVYSLCVVCSRRGTVDVLLPFLQGLVLGGYIALMICRWSYKEPKVCKDS